MTGAEPDAAGAALREAELIAVNAKWRICEARALARLAGRPGLACAPLFPEHPIIQVVTLDGRQLGRIRLSRTGGPPRWIATPVGSAQEIGGYRSARAAARALARVHRRGLWRLRRVSCLPSEEAAPPE
ncbi:hypothetical protein [Streptomyces sp. TP-A0874]|uniref:hypothetical protein n=1 Tax=Streptomyces sp. TP-A0874 TaxID=549819 RepID=UPI000853697F|nr:hypothetical protein [Streptomyces sp. TP-A0874]